MADLDRLEQTCPLPLRPAFKSAALPLFESWAEDVRESRLEKEGQ